MARLSPAQRHFARKMAAVVAAAAAEDTPGGAPLAGGAATAYEMKRAELGEDLRALKSVQAIEHKIARKRELIANYDDWVKGVLDAHAAGTKAVQDDILLQMMIWSLDIQDYERALPLVDYVLRNDLALPERFTRTAPTLIAELSADAALSDLQQGGNPDLAWLQIVEEQTADGDMIDQVRAKLHKAIGLAMAKVAEAHESGGNGPAGVPGAGLRAAIVHLKRALHLHAKCGVKKDIERLERAIVKLPASPQS